MATGDVAVGAPGAGSSAALQTPTSKRIINDFSIQVATVNGSGSQSANLVLLKSIFGMGIPVSGKNLFPSNIAGLPTWYTIRASKQGYVARRREIELLVAMNAETYQRDVREVASGGYLVYDATWPRSVVLQRGDITVIGVPLANGIGQWLGWRWGFGIVAALSLWLLKSRRGPAGLAPAA